MAENDFTIAPDFRLVDTAGRHVGLSDFAGHRHVVLVFTRGFT